MKRIGIVLMAAAFVFSTSTVFAAKCTVESIEGTKVTMECDKADMKVGDNVTVRAKKAKALEGC
ncbi:MAG: selenite/tellurite reduction operon protein ExtJ [Desulfobulbus sp.]